MNKRLNGLQIVAELAGTGEWWRLQAERIRNWVSDLPTSATMEMISRTEWIGDPWDASSNVSVGNPSYPEVVSAKDLASLLAKLRRGIRSMGVDGIVPPDQSSVRVALCSNTRSAVIIDVDFGDFILPISIDGVGWRNRRKPSLKEIAEGMLGILEGAIAIRSRLAQRDAGMRRAFEQTMTRIGEGAAPLWMRLAPVPHYEDASCLPYMQYVMLMVTLNDSLIWAPSGTERVHTVKDVRDYYGYMFREHRARAATIRDLEMRGSAGSVSEVALALIEEHGLNPVKVFQDAVAAAMADIRAGVSFDRSGRTETLYYRDGVVFAAFGFEGGHFYRDTLTLWGDYPETVVEGLKGRRLADIVDHPALVASGAAVSESSSRQAALDLRATCRNIAVEELVDREARLQAA